MIKRSQQQFRRKYGSELDLLRGWWTPPIGPHQAWSLERKQIEQLQLFPLVSLSDHDTVTGCLSVRAAGEHNEAAPVSVEWSLPYEGAELHIGIHNLSVEAAVSTVQVLNEYTRQPCLSGPAAILEWIASHPETLVVLNHPLWDERSVGQDVHMNAVREFLGTCGVFTHALEWNGLRPQAENLRVTGLARAWSKPVISGGDRHTFEANTVLNLTNAECFSEFAAEVRSGHSTVILLPTYRQPLSLRLTRMVCDVFSLQPDHPRGWKRWSERVFYVCPGEHPRSLKDLVQSNGMPISLRLIDAATDHLSLLAVARLGRLTITGRNLVFVS